MKLKRMWRRFISWITFDETNNHHRTDLRSGMDKHYRLDTSYTHNLAEDGPEKVISINKNKMHDFIAEKKNRKPFYKDDNKMNWE